MKKVFILLPDGVGLRNFIYTDFLDHKGDSELVVWTALDNLKLDNIDIIALPKFKNSVIAEAKKRALTQSEIRLHAKKFNNPAFLDYLFPDNNNSVKNKLKNKLKDFYANKAEKSDENILNLRQSYLNSIRKSTYYQECLRSLKQHQPDFVFCTHQRTLVAVAPLLAAKELGIPTGTFIFSWDNLPKGNLAVEADNYFVWSQYMADELQKYYPWVKKEQIRIVGTPQFIPYTDSTLHQSKEEFFKENGLDIEAKTICFSGDDETTSPFDERYLLDLAQTVQSLNEKGLRKYQILFRRCPVDFSGRYDDIVEKYSDIIHVLDPIWSTPGDGSGWQGVVPLEADSALLANSVKHSDLVVNVASTMSIDFGLNGKTACYLDYNVNDEHPWDVHKIYNFIHFQTMDDLDPVYWIHSKDSMEEVVLKALTDNDNKLPNAMKWAQRVSLYPLEDANKRYWNEIHSIMEN